MAILKGVSGENVFYLLNDICIIPEIIMVNILVVTLKSINIS